LIADLDKFEVFWIRHHGGLKTAVRSLECDLLVRLVDSFDRRNNHVLCLRGSAKLGVDNPVFQGGDRNCFSRLFLADLNPLEVPNCYTIAHLDRLEVLFVPGFQSCGVALRVLESDEAVCRVNGDYFTMDCQHAYEMEFIAVSGRDLR